MRLNIETEKISEKEYFLRTDIFNTKLNSRNKIKRINR